MIMITMYTLCYDIMYDYIIHAYVLGCIVRVTGRLSNKIPVRAVAKRVLPLFGG